LASREVPVKICEIPPPLVYATMLPSGNGRLKKEELGSNEPAPAVDHPGIGPKLNRHVSGPAHEATSGFVVSNEAFCIATLSPQAPPVKHRQNTKAQKIETNNRTGSPPLKLQLPVCGMDVLDIAQYARN
jgi:hypothetical protein